MTTRSHSTRLLLLCATSLAALGACRTTTSESLPGPKHLEITRTLAVRAWELWEEGRLLGTIVRFEDPGDPRKAFLSVRNRERQELGIVDVEGRAWRYRPHQREPEWLGTGTVLAGARRILGAGEGARMIEVGVEKLKSPAGQ